MQNKMKRLLAGLLAGAMLFTIACSNTQKQSDTNEVKTEQTAEMQEEVTKFTDSVGREVELSTNIEKIAPSGYVAQIMLYAIVPDKMVGWGQAPKEKQKKYIDEKYANKPEFGAFYGKNANLNMEALTAEAPQLVIDLGEKKDDIAEGMDTIQTQTGIASIFIEASLEKMPEAFTTLGQVLGEEEQAKLLADYCKEAINRAKTNSEKVNNKPKVYYAEGETGLQTIVQGSLHSQTIELIGAENVVQVEKGSKSSAEISMEQLMNWNPDVIIAADEKVYELVTSDSAWTNLKAVQDKKVYCSPNMPYSWVSRPPSINRILGMQWLGNILFPEDYDYDMVKQAQEFYKLFYHYDLSEEEAREMLEK